MFSEPLNIEYEDLSEELNMKMDWNVISILIGLLIIAISINGFEKYLLLVSIAIGTFLFLYPFMKRILLTIGFRIIGRSESEIKALAWKFWFFRL
jgi:hypothetical protein